MDKPRGGWRILLRTICQGAVCAGFALGATSTPDPAALEALLSEMTLAEKIGQMTQVDKTTIDKNPEHITTLFLGSLLSGGGQRPGNGRPEEWRAMVADYANRAARSRLQIPLLFGIDAVHGHNNVWGATLYPHNLGLGATRNPALVRTIATLTARDLAATGIPWNFAPALPVVGDIRWGRTYESFSSDPELVTELGLAYSRGLQHPLPGRPLGVLATAKHFVGDGGVEWGTSPHPDYTIDRGNLTADEEKLRRTHVAPYLPQLAHNVLTVMASYSSWNGVPAHISRKLLTDLLKDELGFRGFVVSDWVAIDSLAGDSYDEKVIAAVNAGIDMAMVVHNYQRFIDALSRAVELGRVPQARIDDAVRRILRVKFAAGLFDTTPSQDPDLAQVGDATSRSFAAQAVRESAVLLRNDNRLLPLDLNQPLKVLLLGAGADDIGLQCGGWSYGWQGMTGNQVPGLTVLARLRQLSPNWEIDIQRGQDASCEVAWTQQGRTTCYASNHSTPPYDIALTVLAEPPYAEGRGDSPDLKFSPEDEDLPRQGRHLATRQLLLLFSGRPMDISAFEADADALIAAWLPGTEGGVLADLLVGLAPFRGRLPVDWPQAATPVGRDGTPTPDNILFPRGFGLNR